MPSVSMKLEWTERSVYVTLEQLTNKIPGHKNFYFRWSSVSDVPEMSSEVILRFITEIYHKIQSTYIHLSLQIAKFLIPTLHAVINFWVSLEVQM